MARLPSTHIGPAQRYAADVMDGYCTMGPRGVGCGYVY